MPFTFIVSGIILISILFEVIKFNDPKVRILFALFLVHTLVGIINGYAIILNFRVNIFAVISVVLFLTLIIMKKKINGKDFFLIVVISTIYMIALGINLNLIINFDGKFAIALILTGGLIFFPDLIRGSVFVYITAVILTLISSIFEINNYSFSNIDMIFPTRILFAYVTLFFVYKIITKYLIKFQGEKLNEKNLCFNNFISNNYTFYVREYNYSSRKYF